MHFYVYRYMLDTNLIFTKNNQPQNDVWMIQSAKKKL